MLNPPTYFTHKSHYRSDANPFKVGFRSAVGPALEKRLIGWLSFPTKGGAEREAARLNAFPVEECAQVGCARRVYRHEVEAREYRGASDADCDRCFAKLVEAQTDMDTAAMARA